MLKKMKDIQAALAENGAMLIFDEHSGVQAYFVQKPNGQRIRCAAVADRLTWGGPNAKVRFSHREPLVRYYELATA